LTYADLRSLFDDPDGREPGRTIEWHLTGHMERFARSFDGIKFSGAEPIRLLYGERLRIVLVNDTMMTHPIHLHGMWSDVENEAGEFHLRKHTVEMPPGTKRSYRVTADASLATFAQREPSKNRTSPASSASKTAGSARCRIGRWCCQRAGKMVEDRLARVRLDERDVARVALRRVSLQRLREQQRRPAASHLHVARRPLRAHEPVVDHGVGAFPEVILPAVAGSVGGALVRDVGQLAEKAGDHQGMTRRRTWSGVTQAPGAGRGRRVSPPSSVRS
jgi:hypothetical protein